MSVLLNILKGLNSNELAELHKLIIQFENSIGRLSKEVREQEKLKEELAHRKLYRYEKIMLRKLRLQRAIMTRYQAGYTLEQIGAYLNYHPKTIARYIRKFQTDLSILTGLETDLDKKKVLIIKVLIKQGLTKRQIVRRLHCSAYLITMVCHREKLKIAA